MWLRKDDEGRVSRVRWLRPGVLIAFNIMRHGTGLLSGGKCLHGFHTCFREAGGEKRGLYYTKFYSMNGN
jgi:hypothetical protein